MLGADFESVDVLTVPVNIADRVADVWSVNPIRINVADEAIDESVEVLLSEIQHVRSMTRSWIRILNQEKHENETEIQVASILSTTPHLRLPIDVVGLIVKYAIPNDLRTTVPDRSGSVTIVVSHTFHQWVWYASRISSPEALRMIRRQRLEEESLYKDIRRQCTLLVMSNLRLEKIIHKLHRSLFSY